MPGDRQDLRLGGAARWLYGADALVAMDIDARDQSSERGTIKTDLLFVESSRWLGVSEVLSKVDRSQCSGAPLDLVGEGSATAIFEDAHFARALLNRMVDQRLADRDMRGPQKQDRGLARAGSAGQAS